jgi:hypothetical protein
MRTTAAVFATLAAVSSAAAIAADLSAAFSAWKAKFGRTYETPECVRGRVRAWAGGREGKDVERGRGMEALGRKWKHRDLARASVASYATAPRGRGAVRWGGPSETGVGSDGDGGAERVSRRGLGNGAR